ncbi:alanine dehydrogenase [Thermodesulforhabdus norvegica]|uniref:Alanine dehydrogenase n=1 Tax=Thermodesulforhabdus norvegica TaxID=39841 RepID=A0A1I4U7S4_9BACT|nr:alanine dehydrogenase [Thermodesulforhabdus norvegica]SFM84955.1 L-alanine dehydrogenase [Thermodesulforhabdus norvegica]
MVIGIPREVKDNEYRVAQTPGGVSLLVQRGHRVIVQAGAGEGSGFSDREYEEAGAEILSSAADVWTRSEMIVKVKEPLPEEYPFLRPGLILFTFLHLAADERLTHELLRRGTTAIAYETVELSDGRLPLLVPMSEVAGRMAVQVGAHYLEKSHGGRGKLLGGIPGVRPADVVIIGGGTVGINAAKIALGMGAHVTIIEKNPDRLRYLDDVLSGNLTTLASNPRNIEDSVRVADLVIGAVLIPGARAPRIVKKELVAQMKPGSVILDVAVDQGGCVETIRPTTHSQPTYLVDGVIHYGVTNMPGAVPRTSTYGLSNATLPYILHLADLGFEEAVSRDRALAKGVNAYKGHLTHPEVAAAFGLEYTPLDRLL